MPTLCTALAMDLCKKAYWSAGDLFMKKEPRKRWQSKQSSLRQDAAAGGGVRLDARAGRKMQTGFFRGVSHRGLAHCFSAGRWCVVAKRRASGGGNRRSRWCAHENVIEQVLQTAADARLVIADVIRCNSGVVKRVCHGMPRKRKSGFSRSQSSPGSGA